MRVAVALEDARRGVDVDRAEVVAVADHLQQLLDEALRGVDLRRVAVEGDLVAAHQSTSTSGNCCSIWLSRRSCGPRRRTIAIPSTAIVRVSDAAARVPAGHGRGGAPSGWDGGRRSRSSFLSIGQARGSWCDSPSGTEG